MANLFAIPWRPVMQNNLVVAGAKIYFTLTGTNTASAPFSDSALTTPRTNPVIADGVGKIPTTYLDPGKSYRVRIYSRSATVGVDTPLEEYDPYVPGVFADADALEPVAEAAAASAASAAASAASAAAALLSLLADDVAAGIALPRVTPEMYGALGDGSDDGPALAAMSAAISALGRGAIDFYPGRTYWVGSQTLNGTVLLNTYRYGPTTLYPVYINGCTGPVVINPNGARIKCLAGKKYGSFDVGGTAHVGQSVTPADAATPYLAMVHIQDCTGPVVFTSPLELDGNISAATIGGGYGDAGIQLQMSGILLTDNTGPLVIDVDSHHHGEDGGTGDGPGLLTVKESVVIKGRYRNCGRNNFSLVGGNGWHFADGIELSGAGKDLGATMTYSSPAAGLDLEAEGGKYVLNTTMSVPYIDDNTGPGILSSTNAFVSGFYCKGGIIIGTTDWSIWPDNPSFVFDGALILGAVTNPYRETDPTKSTQFRRCVFSDDVTLSSTGTLYNTLGTHLFIDSSVNNTNLLFDECRFEKHKLGSSESMTSANPATLKNCSFINVALDAGMTIYGTRTGERSYHSASQGNPGGQGGAVNSGAAWDSFDVNGTRYPATVDRATGKNVYYGTATYNPPSLAAAAKDTIQTMTVTGVALGDSVEDVSFSLNLAGARIPAWVSAANTVSYYAINENGANPLDLASGTVRVKVRQA